MKVVFENENQVLIPIIHYLCNNTLRNSDLRGYFYYLQDGHRIPFVVFMKGMPS